MTQAIGIKEEKKEGVAEAAPNVSVGVVQLPVAKLQLLHFGRLLDRHADLLPEIRATSGVCHLENAVTEAAIAAGAIQSLLPAKIAAAFANNMGQPLR